MIKLLVKNKISLILSCFLISTVTSVRKGVGQSLQASPIQKALKTNKASNPPAKEERVEEKTLKVSTALKHFTVTYNENRVAVKGHQVDLNLDRKECNAHIIKRFNKETDSFIKDFLKKREKNRLVEKAAIDTVEVQIQGKGYFTPSSSSIGRIALYFPQEILRMKWEEKLNCEKNTKKNTKKIKQ